MRLADHVPENCGRRRRCVGTGVGDLALGAVTSQLAGHVSLMRRAGMHSRAVYLASAVSAKSWSQDRRAQEGISTDFACPSCSVPHDTQCNCDWACSSNDGQAFDDSCHFAARAQAEAVEWPCFWLRDILPQERMPPPPLPVLDVVHHDLGGSEKHSEGMGRRRIIVRGRERRQECLPQGAPQGRV